MIRIALNSMSASSLYNVSYDLSRNRRIPWTRTGAIAMKEIIVTNEEEPVSIARDGVISTNGRKAYGAQEIIAVISEDFKRG